MTITTLAQYKTAPKQRIQFQKISVNVIAFQDTSLVVGSPGQVTAVANNTTGIVPVASDTGYPTLNSFNGGVGYLSRMEFSTGSTAIITQVRLYDRLFWAGPLTAGTTMTLSSLALPARIPNSDYTQLELWISVLTTATGAPNFVVTYTNAIGALHHTTPAPASVIPLVAGSMLRLPLQAGDGGISIIESVQENGASATGTFSVMILRKIGLLGDNRNGPLGPPILNGVIGSGLPIVYETSALMMQALVNNASFKVHEMFIEVASG
jgi:hypothetical protein